MASVFDYIFNIGGTALSFKIALPSQGLCY